MPRDEQVLWRIRTRTTGISTPVRAMLRHYSVAERLGRSARTLGAFLLIAVVVAFIPIVHVFGIPLALLAGIVLSVQQFRVSTTIRSAHATCPKCGTEQKFYVGTGLGGLKLPVAVSCDDCRKDLEIDDPARAA
jgi:hypothetical protein